MPLCYVASGNFDFALHYGGMGIWDGLIPKLIIEEAGEICEITQYSKNKFSIIAGSKNTVKIIKEIIK